MLIYKPARQFMTPNNVPIDPAVENEFELTVGGQICKAYRFSVFDMENNKVDDASTGRIDLDSPLYDGDILKHKIGAGKLDAGNTYKWQMDLYAEDVEFPISVTAKQHEVGSIGTGTSHYFTLADTSVVYSNGTEVHFECDSPAEEWPKNIKPKETYFLRQNFGSSNTSPGRYYIYSSKENAEADSTTTTGRIQIGGGELPDSSNKFYMVKGTFASEMSCGQTHHNFSTGDVVFVGGGEEKPSSFKDYTPYYVRSINTNTIKLYDNIEGARNDAGGIAIKDGTKAIISNVATSEQIVFSAYDTPSFVLRQEILNSHTHTFVPEYSHPQGVMINNWTARVCVGDNTDEFDSSGTIYRSKVEYTYDGLLSGVNYCVCFDAETNVGQKITTGWVSFIADYQTQEIDIVPTATNDEFNACVHVSWGGLVSIPGVFFSGDPKFVDDFVVVGNRALNIGNGQSLTYSNVKMTEDSMPPRFWWSPNSEKFNGVIMSARNTNTMERVIVGYEGGAFYLEVNNSGKQRSEQIKIDPKYAYLISFMDEKLDIYTVGLKQAKG